MNKAEYKAYEEAVAQFFAREGISHLSPGEMVDEFSRRSCDCCRTRLAGARHEALSYNRQTQSVEVYEVCSNCLYYDEYGQLDDLTMIMMED